LQITGSPDHRITRSKEEIDTVGSRRKLFVFLFAGLMLLAYTSAAYAAHNEIPRITIAETKKLMDSKTDIVIVDTQIKSLYDKGHIKGAINVPWKEELSAEDTQKLPKDKLIITYCDCGPGESDSSDVAAQLTNLGFIDVKVLADPAIRGWIKAGYPTEK
jgi:rhodanese-related sulfurtransferase